MKKYIKNALNESQSALTLFMDNAENIANIEAAASLLIGCLKTETPFIVVEMEVQ